MQQSRWGEMWKSLFRSLNNMETVHHIIKQWKKHHEIFCDINKCKRRLGRVLSYVKSLWSPWQWMWAKWKLPWHCDYVVLTIFPLSHVTLAFSFSVLTPSCSLSSSHYLSSSLHLCAVNQKANITTKLRIYHLKEV